MGRADLHTPQSFEGRSRGSQQARIVTKRAELYRGVRCRAVCEGTNSLAHGAEQHVPHLEQASRERDQVWVEDVDEPTEADSKHMATVADFSLGEAVTFPRRLGEVSGGRITVTHDLFQRLRPIAGHELSRALAERNAAHNSLKTSFRPAVAAWSGWVDDHVADLTGESARTAVEAAINHEPATDAGAESSVHQVSRTLTGSKTKFTKRGRGRVILDGHWEAQCLRERRAKVEAAKARNVRGDTDFSSLRVDEAGGRDADGIRTTFCRYRTQQLHHLTEYRRCVDGLRTRDVATGGDSSVHCHEGRAKLRAAKIACENRPGHDPHCSAPPTVARTDDLRRCRIGRHPWGMFEPWQQQLLRESKVGHLGTLGPDGAPHLVPVCYALLNDDSLVIAIDEKPKRAGRLARLQHIDRDPRVSLLVDVYDDDNWERLAWVRSDGQASVVEIGGERADALVELRARYAQYRSMALEQRPLIVISPRRVTSWRASTA